MKDQKSGPNELNILSRRDFFLVFGSIFALSFLGLRLLAGLYFRRFTNAHQLTNLSKVSKNTLVALFPYMTGENDSSKIKKSLTAINNYLSHLSPRVKFELELALLFFNQATILIGSMAPFPYLSHEKKLRYLDYLSTGPRFFGPIFLGLKEVCLLGQYALEENCNLIPGYETLVPKQGDPDPEFNSMYEHLEAR